MVNHLITQRYLKVRLNNFSCMNSMLMEEMKIRWMWCKAHNIRYKADIIRAHFSYIIWQLYRTHEYFTYIRYFIVFLKSFIYLFCPQINRSYPAYLPKLTSSYEYLMIPASKRWPLGQMRLLIQYDRNKYTRKRGYQWKISRAQIELPFVVI